MKMPSVLGVLAALVGGVAAVQFAASDARTPMADVVQLIAELKTKVIADGEVETKSYDMYACWCEDTSARKAADISTTRKLITDLTETSKKLKGEIAVHGSEVENLDGAIAGNIAAQKEASELRASRNGEYMGTKTESEQCIGALEGAITVLNGAGTGKKAGFLMTMQEAKVLGAVAGLREILRHPAFGSATSPSDLKIVRDFVEHPDKYLGGSMRLAPAVSNLQVANNPFGDYAPQSTQIQGILKSMYDAFVADLEKSNAEESEEQKAFDELMATKKTELATLKATHEQHSLDKASKGTSLTETKQSLDDAKIQLEADTKFFEATKQTCKDKAAEWSERSRLRTEELMGMNKAVEILSGGEATFENATTTFLQIAARSAETRSASLLRTRVVAHLRDLAKRRGSRSLRRVVLTIGAGGHFDKVIAAIDEMMSVLRKEEQDDIAHRDRCQGDEFKNKNDMDGLDSKMEKLDASLGRMDNEAGELNEQINTLENEINQTTEEMKQMLKLRNEAVAAFKQAMADDTTAVSLINKAIVALTKFYKRNKIPLNLAQGKQPEYTVDPDKTPKVAWQSGYGGRSTESLGIISILSMLAEDLELEMTTARKDDAAAQADYEEQRSASRKALAAQTASKTATESELADLKAGIEKTKESKAGAGASLSDQKEMQAALSMDCSWVKTHFKTRNTKRKAEMKGLTDAKAYLAGVEAGEEV